MIIIEKKKIILEKKKKKEPKRIDEPNREDSGHKLLIKDETDFLNINDSNFDFNLFSEKNNLFCDSKLLKNKNKNKNEENKRENSNSLNDIHENNNMITNNRDEKKVENIISTWWFDDFSKN